MRDIRAWTWSRGPERHRHEPSLAVPPVATVAPLASFGRTPTRGG